METVTELRTTRTRRSWEGPGGGSNRGSNRGGVGGEGGGGGSEEESEEESEKDSSKDSGSSTLGSLAFVEKALKNLSSIAPVCCIVDSLQVTLKCKFFPLKSKLSFHSFTTPSILLASWSTV